MAPLKLLGAGFVFLVVVYLIPPVVFKCSRPVQRYLLFMNRLEPQNELLRHPEQVGLHCSRVLRLEYEDKYGTESNASQPIHLGVWHISPHCHESTGTTNNKNHPTGPRGGQPGGFSGDKRPIVLYLHGNNGNRATDYRVRLYKQLVDEFAYHLVTFDYRGYGDSSDASPSTFGLTSDARSIYNWLLAQTNVTRDRVSVWGHSLGTAVAVRLLANLPPGRQPRKLILEAPFDSMVHVLHEHRWTLLHRRMPYFEKFVVEPVESSPELNFNSLECIGNITTPGILILHAEDDSVIAHRLSANLYEEAARKLGRQRVRFLSLPAKYSLGHDHIGSHRDTMLRVQQFIELG